MIKKSKIFNISAKYYDYIYKKKEYLKETNFVSQFFPSNKKKLNILDLGMGTGNHLINLIKKGHKVDGVELSSDMIRIAGGSGLERYQRGKRKGQSKLSKEFRDLVPLAKQVEFMFFDNKNFEDSFGYLTRGGVFQ